MEEIQFTRHGLLKLLLKHSCNRCESGCEKLAQEFVSRHLFEAVRAGVHSADMTCSDTLGKSEINKIQSAALIYRGLSPKDDF